MADNTYQSPHRPDSVTKFLPVKRLTRFNLRFFLIVITAICIWFPIRLQRAERQQKGVEYVLENGGSVKYDFQYSAGVFDSTIESKVPKPFIAILGRDFFHSVVSADLTEQVDTMPDLFANGMQVFVYPIASIISNKEPIRDLCKAFPNLERLTVDRRNAFDRNFEHIGTLKHLKHLSIQNSRHIKDEGLFHLGNCRKLETVYVLGESKITDDSLKVIGGLPNLKRINVRSANLSDTGIRYLKGCKQLEKAWFVPPSRRSSKLGLDSPNSQFTDEALEILAGLPNLKSLAIASPLFTNDGAGHLANLENIERIVLRSKFQKPNAIDDLTLRTLQANKLLTEVDLIGSKVTPNGVEEFSIQLPACRIKPAFLPERARLRVSSSNNNAIPLSD
jgi:hypothetical protein